jgi:hypothetical protein
MTFASPHPKSPICTAVNILFTPVKDVEKADEEILRYDKEKYKEMILDGAQSVLGYFGFDRIIYGDIKNTTPRKWRWLQELRQQREKDIKTEMI